MVVDILHLYRKHVAAKGARTRAERDFERSHGDLRLKLKRNEARKQVERAWEVLWRAVEASPGWTWDSRGQPVRR